MTPDPKKQSIIKAPSRAVAKARSNMASRAFASVHKTTITNSIGMKLKLIPAGEFLMGSRVDEEYPDYDQKPHRIRITQPFYMGHFTVTQSQWLHVMKTEPWKEKRFVKEGSNYPASYVSHADAIAFCRKVTERETANYRLPTEAEWEYACRAGTSSLHWWGDECEAVNYDDEELRKRMDQRRWACVNYYLQGEDYPHRVGLTSPNPWGLFDMIGNISEWCSDWYGEKYYWSSPSKDPKGPNNGVERVMRGGAWNDETWSSATRYASDPTSRYKDIGFRVCLSPSDK